MSLVRKENLFTAQQMYVSRIEFLQSEVARIVSRGIQLGAEYEEETMSALDEIDEELNGIDECLCIIKHILRNTDG